MPSKVSNGSLIVLCMSMLTLFIGKQLTLYIHPRYITFTVFFVSISMIVLAVDLLYAKQETLPKTTIAIVLLAIISIALPPQSLSPQLAATRSDSSGSIDTSILTTADAFTTDFSNADIRDWAALLRSNPPASSVVGKKASVEGFIYTTEEQVFIARYQLTCCAVDATPLSVPLYLQEYQQNEFYAGRWMQLEGIMIEGVNSAYPLQLQPTRFTPFEEPKQPYVF